MTSEKPLAPATIHRGKASSFADPADVARYRAAKKRGLTDAQAFKRGDNGVGFWGDDTTVDRPMCALPPEDWRHLTHPAGTPVKVTANGRTIICELRDKMPAKRKIKNGAIIDLNPGAVRLLGLKPPIMVPAEWEWA